MIALDSANRPTARPKRGASTRPAFSGALATEGVVPVLCAALAHCPLSLFDRIDTWPAIDALLRDESTRLAKIDLHDWSTAGGVLGPDGQPTFGAPSAAALGIITGVIQQHRRFRYRDGTGTEWAVLVVGDHAEFWQALAIGPGVRADVLCETERTRLLEQARYEMSCLVGPGKRQTADSLRQRAALSRMQGWLTGLNVAFAAVEWLYHARASGSGVRVRAQGLARKVWGDSQIAWPDDWRAALYDGLATLVRVELQVIRFQKTGWNPEPQVRQPAVTGVGWVGPETLEVHLSPLFVAMLGEYLGPSCGQ